MTRLLVAALRWLFRHVLLLLAIMLILLGGLWLRAGIGHLHAARTELAAVQRDLAMLDGEPARIVKWIEALVPDVARTTQASEALRQRLAAEREQREREQASIQARDPFVSRVPGHPAYLSVARLDIEIDLLQKAERHVAAQARLVTALRDIAGARALNRNARAAVGAAIGANLSQRRVLSAAHPILRQIPWAGVYRQIERLDTDRHAMTRWLAELDAQSKQVDAAERFWRDATRAFRTGLAEVRQAFATTRQQFDNRAAAIAQDIHDNPWRRLSEEFMSVLVPALVILLLAVFSGPLLKAFAFFVAAPLAAHQPPLRVLPGESGELRSGATQARAGKVSDSSLPVRLDAGEELLVHAGFLQTRPTSTPVTTRLWLDPTRPFTSLAADMALVQRVLPDAGREVLLSSTQQDLLELAMLELPQFAALVLRPRALAGVVQHCGRPVRISSHWHLASLHSWMNLQFRYLVFHGPGRLIVKGSRGVILESAANGRVVNQAGVLGWSAGIDRASTRCDSFAAYLLGEQDLLNDRFHGTGFIVYEEMPGAGASRHLLFGKGLSGLADSVLRVFGI